MLTAKLAKKITNALNFMSQTAFYPRIPEIADQRTVSVLTPHSTYSVSPVSQFLTPVNQYSGGYSDDQDDTVKLSDVLNVLDYENEACIFIVRRISKLGHAANDSLYTYFNQFGRVRRILLLPSRGKCDSRTRPASMGFVVMESAFDCNRICQGLVYRIGFSDVNVQKFVRNAKVQLNDGYSNAYLPMYSAPERFMSSELKSPLDGLDSLVDSMIACLGI